MATNTWNTSGDGNILYQQITKEHLEASLSVLKDSFFPDETVCKAVGVDKCEDSIIELQTLAEEAARDGVSLIAFDQENKRIAGVLFNKIQVFNEQEESYFEQFAKNCKHSKARGLVQFMIDFDRLCNLFELCQTNCLLELMFIGVLPEYRNQGIGKQLYETTLAIGGLLKSGKNVKQPLSETLLDLEPRPQAACSIGTSPYTQKIGKSLEFSIAVRKSNKNVEFQGKNFASILGDETGHIELIYKDL